MSIYNKKIANGFGFYLLREYIWLFSHCELVMFQEPQINLAPSKYKYFKCLR